MIPDKEQFEELCAAFALGALDTEEQTLFDDAVAQGGVEYQKIFRESIGISQLINTSITQITPSPMIKSKLLKTIKRGERSSLSFSFFIEELALRSGFGSPRFGLLVAFLLLIVVAEVGTYAFLLHHDLIVTEQLVSSSELRISDQQQNLLKLSTELQQQEAMLDILQSPTIEIVKLSGQDVNPSGFGKLFLDPVHNVAILQVSNLPAVPSDKDYQVWSFDKDKNTVSSGIFTVTGHNKNYYKISIPQNSKDITTFTVTLEPKGGVQQPTGAVYLLGSPRAVK